MRTTQLVIGVGIMSIGLAGCGGGTKAADTTTIINQTVMPSSASAASATTAASASASASLSPSTTASSGAAQPQATDLPQPPAGATQVQTGTDNGVAKAKYSIADQLPDQVMEYYTNLLRNDGYTIVTSKSGPDSGRKGGATAVASKNGVFVGVEADADAGEPTHFDVCQGPNEAAVRDCID